MLQQLKRDRGQAIRGLRDEADLVAPRLLQCEKLEDRLLLATGTMIGHYPADRAIPDQGSVTAEEYLQGAPSNAVITDVDLSFFIDHTWRGDLEARLTTLNNGDWHDFIRVPGGLPYLNDWSGSYSGLDVWDGFSANRTWYFRVDDLAGGDTGHIEWWQIDVEWSAPDPDPEITFVSTDVFHSAASGDSVDWSATVHNSSAWDLTDEWTVSWYLSTDTSFSGSDIFVGSETYGADLDSGQFLSVTETLDVPSGLSGRQYYVIARVATNGSGNTDATSSRKWFGSIGTDSDDGIGNGTSLFATNLGPINGTFTRTNRTLNRDGDNDWYRFQIDDTGIQGDKVRIDFNDSEGDLWLELYNDSGVRLERSNSVNDFEEVSLSGLAPGQYRIQVDGYVDDVSRDYDITIVAAALPDPQVTDIYWGHTSVEAGQQVSVTVAGQALGGTIQLQIWESDLGVLFNTGMTIDVAVGSSGGTRLWPANWNSDSNYGTPSLLSDDPEYVLRYLDDIRSDTSLTVTDTTDPFAPSGLQVGGSGTSRMLSWSSTTDRPDDNLGSGFREFVVRLDGVEIYRGVGTSVPTGALDLGAHSWSMQTWDIAGNHVTTSGPSFEITAPPPLAAITAFAPPTGLVARGDTLLTSVTVRNNDTVTRPYWVGLSFAHETAGEWPIGWYDIRPLPTDPLAPGQSTTVTFAFEVPRNLQVGQYFAVARTWENFNTHTYLMEGPIDSTLATPAWTDDPTGDTSFVLPLLSLPTDSISFTDQLADIVRLIQYIPLTTYTNGEQARKPMLALRIEGGGTVPGPAGLININGGGTILFDLADMIGITPEGQAGWITTWIDADASLTYGLPAQAVSFSSTISIIDHSFNYFERAVADDRRQLTGTVGAIIPGFTVTLADWSSTDGFAGPSLAWNGEFALGLQASGGISSLVTFEWNRQEIINAFVQASGGDLLTYVTDIVDHIANVAVRSTTFDDGAWPILPGQWEGGLILSDGYNAADGVGHFFAVDVPDGISSVDLIAHGANVDLYANWGGRPSLASHDYFADGVGNDITVSVPVSQPGRLYLWLAADTSFGYDNVRLIALLDNAPPPDQVPPAAPSSLLADAVSSRAIELSWIDNSDDEDGFEIWYRTDGTATMEPLTRVGPGQTSYTHKGLTPATTYYYEVRAFNGAGDSTPSNTASATTHEQPITLPIAPSDLTASPNGPTSIILRWYDNSSNETGFEIFYCVGNTGAFQHLETVAAGAGEHTHQDLLPETVYEYWVRAVNDVGSSPPSNIASASTDARPVTVPIAPDGLVATAGPSRDDSMGPAPLPWIDLQWNDNSDNEDQFEIEYRISGSAAFVHLADVAAGETTYRHSDLTLGTTYDYRVRAINSAGPSPWSNEASATTPTFLDDHANAGQWTNGTVISLDIRKADGAATGVIDFENDTDLFVFTALDDGPARIQLVTASGSILDASVRIFNSAQAQIAFNSQGLPGATANLQFQAVGGQQYFVLVEPAGSSQGGYTLRLDTDPQTHYLYYPEGYSSNTISEFIPLVNPNDFDVTYTIFARYETGQRDQIIAEGTVAANSRGGITINERGNPAARLVRPDTPYAIEVQSDGPLGATFSHYDFGITTGENFTDILSTTWTFAEARRGADFRDFLVFYNPNDHTTVVHVKQVYENGTINEFDINVGAFRRGGVNFHTNSLVDLDGTFALVVTADSSIVAALSSYNTTKARGYGMLGQVGHGALRGVIPMLSAGDDIESGLSIFNSGAAQAEVTIRAIYDGGSFDLVRSVEPNSILRLTSSELGVPNDVTAAITYTSSTPVTVNAFQFQQGDGDATAAATAAGTTFLFGDAWVNPPFAGTTYIENLGVFNPTDIETTITLTFLFEDGTTATTSVTVAANNFARISIDQDEAIRSRSAETPFSLKVEATVPVLTAFVHYDLFLNGGWGTLGSPLGFTNALPLA